MGLREELGGKLETALNKLVDEKMSTLGKEMLKEKAMELAVKLVEDNYEKLMTGLADKLKKDVIDLIDGEDDIK